MTNIDIFDSISSGNGADTTNEGCVTIVDPDVALFDLHHSGLSVTAIEKGEVRFVADAFVSPCGRGYTFMYPADLAV